MRTGYNSTRRNRNIGTARQGHGQDNRLVIPSMSGDDRVWFEQLGPYARSEFAVAGGSILLIVETTHGGCVHACSEDDVRRMIQAIPAHDLAGLGAVVFRQPRRKERLLRPAWGRLVYDARIGRIGRPDAYRGPAILIEAVNPDKPVKWSTSLSPDDLEELRRLEADGHVLERRGNTWAITPNVAAVRNTQLYRTLPHEIGHWVDWQEKVRRPGQEQPERLHAFEDAYFARPRSEREAFAHRYADEVRARLEKFGVIPLAPTT